MRTGCFSAKLRFIHFLFKFIPCSNSEGSTFDKSEHWFDTADVKVIIAVIKLNIGNGKRISSLLSVQQQRKRPAEIPPEFCSPVPDCPAFVAIGKQCFAIIAYIADVNAPFIAEPVIGNSIYQNPV